MTKSRFRIWALCVVMALLGVTGIAAIQLHALTDTEPVRGELKSNDAPTGSPVKVIRDNYHADAIAPLQRIIESDSKGLAAAVKSFRAKKQPIGNVELDICISDDRNFVALQLLQFGDEYTYHPITEPAFFEGEQAQLVASIL